MAGGRLPQDGFEDLIKAVRKRLSWADELGVEVEELGSDPEIEASLCNVEEKKTIHKLDNLESVLRQWPDIFEVFYDELTDCIMVQLVQEEHDVDSAHQREDKWEATAVGSIAKKWEGTSQDSSGMWSKQQWEESTNASESDVWW